MLVFNWTGWTTWVPLIGFDFTTVLLSAGADVIAASSPVNRAIDSDEEGFLDVGESDSLRSWLQA